VTTAPQLNFHHLLSLSNSLGTFEHAKHAEARVEHGYCTDDVARVMVVAMREPTPSEEIALLADTSLDFLRRAQGPEGLCRNRRDSFGRWFGEESSADCWGRSIWAFGTTAARSSDPDLKERARVLFARGSQVRSTWPRSMAFATLGAAEVLTVDPSNDDAFNLIQATAKLLDRPETIRGWHWSEERLTYANAVLPEAMLAAGSVLGDGGLVDTGLRQLRWLLDMASLDGHLSVTPVSGRGQYFDGERFDQQPIEVAALADACALAHKMTGKVEWSQGVELAVQWFLGANDVGSPMFEPDTGGGFDGLTATGPNLNQGAESTLAMLSTFQQAHQFELVRA
jgi:hypothetical protein